MTAVAPGPVAVRPREFTFAVPGDWVRIRVLDDAQRDADVRRIARAVTRGCPDRDRLMPQVARVLHDAAAARTGSRTVEVHLPVPHEGAPPAACALAVGVVPPRVGGRPGAEEAAFLAAGGPGASAQVVELPCGPVARLRRRVLAPAPDGRRVETAVVQYQHPMPGGGFVLLSFSTPLLELIEPLRALFDAVAGSFRWLP